MKRFYKLVSVARQPGGFAICLDGKSVKTPAGAALLAPTEALADAVMKEWMAQVEKIDPETMPLTQILSTRIDRVGAERPAMTAALLKYLDTDLLCYRAEEEEVAKKQAALWDSPLQWFTGKFGALETTSALKALRQPAPVHGAVATYVAALDDDRFAILQLVTALSGSLILGLAFAEGETGPNQVFAAAHVEESHKGEIYNEKLYGLAPHEERRRAAMRRDLEAAALYRQTLAAS